jgi:WD40 repeat protein
MRVWLPLIGVLALDCASYVDSDGDSLADEGEAKAGTDPLREDSDGDGVWDGFEVSISRTDPLRPDSDGDGASDGEELASCTDPNFAGDAAIDDPARLLAVHERESQSIAISPNGDFVVAGFEGPRALATATSTSLPSFDPEPMQFIRALAMSPDGRWVASLSRGIQSGRLALYSTRVAGLKRTVFVDGEQTVDFPPDASQIAIASTDRIAIFTVDPLQSVAERSVRALEAKWSPAGDRIAFRDETALSVWDRRTDQSVALYSDAEPGAFAWSPDGRSIAHAIHDPEAQRGAISIIDSTTGTEQIRLTSHCGRINDVAWAPLPFIVSGADDRTIKVWNGSTSRPSRTLLGSIGPVKQIAIASSTSRIATIGWHDESEKVRTVAPRRIVVWDVQF